MKPSEVPDELVQLGAQGGMGVDLRVALSRVLPEHERQVREQVAAEIARESLGSAWDAGGMQRAAEIARGEA